ncbi:AraC family transcriptional regulator [Paenibacillus qinlingensis]|uniref:AraC family transcriptional regulator n=1 Tax=Paenibacillus qinlingensis TaxID=1837343 RepID=UPI00156388D0|nr:AraC family transcriptional regulator [Paenibacillus qinlingensis]NQX60102.1 AraC family transcriptional regulator [Paenibacillus qinlingensis]
MRRQMFIAQLPNNPYFCFPESCGWYNEDPNHSAIRLKGELMYFNLHIILSGQGTVTLQDQVYEVKAGDCFLFFPGEEQKYESSGSDPWEVRWMHIYGEGLLTYMTEKGFHRTPLWSFSGSMHELSDAMHRVLEALEGPWLQNKNQVSALTYLAITEWMMGAVPFTSRKSYERMDRIKGILGEMQQKAAQPFVLEEWADRAKTSAFYFCRLFHQITGMTPLTYMTVCRIQNAKQLLLSNPERTVKSIGEEIGYIQTSYFNRRFLQQEGVTPTEYRKLHLGK